MELRQYQVEISNRATEILEQKKAVALFAEVRTGKTLMALQTCHNVKAKSVLFITKKKAIKSILSDYSNFGYTYALEAINRESIHKINGNAFDVVVIDEVHGYTSFPKPSKYYKEIKKRFGNLPMIFLSGTPTPESYSQYYHLFSLSNNHIFSSYVNFYKWAKDYVNVKQKRLGYAIVNDYSDAIKNDFWHLIKDNIITFTQVEAGFTTNVKEVLLEVEMKPITYKLIDKLNKDLVIISKSGKEIIADTGVKLQQKIHQLSSGTIKFEDGTSQTIDDTKAVYIRDKFEGNKIAIFYNFVAELQMLKDTIGDKLTTDLDEFNSTDKWIALQIVSGREGISLAKADYMVMFNIQFSAVSYFQSRDRLTTMSRKDNTIYWLFAKNGIENKIYKSVMNKRNYTLSNFKKDYGVKNTKENNNSVRAKRLLSS